MREHQSRDRSYDAGIHETGNDDEDKREENGRTKLFRYHVVSLDRANENEDDVDELDADEGHNEPTDAVDDEIPAQNYSRWSRTVFHSSQRQRNQRDDD